MHSRFSLRSTVRVGAILAIAGSALVAALQPAQAQGRGGRRAPPPSVAMTVEWKAVPGAVGTRPGVPNQVPVTQGNVTDPNVVLQHYGAGKQLVTANGDPSSVWSGECEDPFAITFRRKDAYLDLTGRAKIRWTTKTSGFHVVRPVLKLADGTMLVGDFASTNVPMLAMTEFPIATIRWAKLDPARVVTVNTPGGSNGEIWVSNPDLSRVDEVGFADLMPASGHGSGGYIHLGTIEVFGTTVPRTAATTSSR